jgi:uncharacterized protein YcbX
MYVKELWRYPVKSTAGEPLQRIHVSKLGLQGDREILAMTRRILTSRTHPGLLALRSEISATDGVAQIAGHRWDSPEALELVRSATGEPSAALVRHDGPERFDILPLLVATDGAIAHLNIDGRRLRPNIVVGGVEGLAERTWPGKRLRIGDAVVIEAAQLRGRCVMTTYDPDTQVQDLNVLRRIAHEFDGTMALDSAVISGGDIEVGAPVTLIGG